MERIFVIFFIIIILITGCASTLHFPPGVNKSEFYIASWYAPYDSARGLNSFSANVGLFREINPVWYNLNPLYFSAGEHGIVTQAVNKERIISLCRENDIKILPTIQNWGVNGFDPQVVGEIINDPDLREDHVKDIVELVLTEGYDGIDIDYESLPARDREGFSEFIGELGTALKRYKKLLSVTVYAKTSEYADWPGPGAQDWSELVKNVDTLKVMVYDYHWAAFHPGPISPIDWLKDVLVYAETVPGLTGKIVIGLPLYGLDWAGDNTGIEVMYQDILSILDEYRPYNYSRNDVYHYHPVCGAHHDNVEMHFDYYTAEDKHTVYFQDAVSLRERLTIIGQYRSMVKGVTFWRLGGEDPEIWNELRRFIAKDMVNQGG